MIQTVSILTILIDAVILIWLMDHLRFLAPFRRTIWFLYSWVVILYFGLLFANTFALVFSIYRKLLLKETGAKLEQLERQLR